MQDTETTTDELPIDMTLAVRVFDTDHKGYIESADLRFIILNMDYSIPRDELNELIKSSNLDQDKKISYQGETNGSIVTTETDKKGFLIGFMMTINNVSYQSRIMYQHCSSEVKQWDYRKLSSQF